MRIEIEEVRTSGPQARCAGRVGYCLGRQCATRCLQLFVQSPNGHRVQHRRVNGMIYIVLSLGATVTADVALRAFLRTMERITF